MDQGVLQDLKSHIELRIQIRSYYRVDGKVCFCLCVLFLGHRIRDLLLNRPVKRLLERYQ